MEFFNSAVDVLKTLVVALGAGLGAVSYTHLDVYKRQGQQYALYHVTKQQNIFHYARMALCRPGAFLSLYSLLFVVYFSFLFVSAYSLGDMP